MHWCIFLGLPAVITFATTSFGLTGEGIPLPEALRELEKAGAAVVGLNCHRGPETMKSLITECRKVCQVNCYKRFLLYNWQEAPTNKYMYSSILGIIRQVHVHLEISALQIQNTGYLFRAPDTITNLKLGQSYVRF